MLPVARKDVLPTTQKSFVIYEYKYHCDSMYVRNHTKPDCDSAIGQHLLENDQCALNHDNKRFSVLAKARSSFHLDLLEAVYINTQRRYYADIKSLFTLSNF